MHIARSTVVFAIVVLALLNATIVESSFKSLFSGKKKSNQQTPPTGAVLPSASTVVSDNPYADQVHQLYTTYLSKINELSG